MEIGQGRKFAFGEAPVNVRAKVIGVPQTTGQQLSYLKEVISLAFKCQIVEGVVRRLGLSDLPYNLYTIFEDMVHNADVSGDQARHGYLENKRYHQKKKRPPTSMTPQEAKDFIVRMTNQWLNYKLSQYP